MELYKALNPATPATAISWASPGFDLATNYHFGSTRVNLKPCCSCAACLQYPKANAQAGVTSKYTYLPDPGFNGNGHFMMAEANNGELAGVIINLAIEIEK